MWPVAGDDPAKIDARWWLTPWRDGWRCLVVLDDRVRILTRVGRDLAPRLPRLAAALAAHGPRRRSAERVTILDGVLPLPGDAASAEAPSPNEARELELLDILCCEGRDVTGRDLAGRRDALRSLAVRERDGIRILPAWRLSAQALLEQSLSTGAHGYSGLLARHPAAPYRPGRRTSEWIAFVEQRFDELVLCGITASGSLVLGMPTAHGLTFAGVTWPTKHWSRLALRCREGPPAFPSPSVWGSLGRIAWATPELWVAASPDVRPGSGRNGPRWRFIRVQEDLSPGEKKTGRSASAVAPAPTAPPTAPAVLGSGRSPASRDGAA